MPLLRRSAPVAAPVQPETTTAPVQSLQRATEVNTGQQAMQAVSDSEVLAASAPLPTVQRALDGRAAVTQESGAPAAPGTQAADVENLARQVYQLISRRLRAEFERAYGSQRR
ncbi:MAG: hypothetical protein ACUVX9_08720 [Anaerolineae bacterium]